MDLQKPNRSILKNILVKSLVFSVFIICFRFAYVITIRGESCSDVGDFCFFSMPLHDTLNLISTSSSSTDPSLSLSSDGPPDTHRSKKWRTAVQFYSSVFQDLISDGFLSPNSKTLCVGSPEGKDVVALRELGVSESTGVSDTGEGDLVVGYKNGKLRKFPFKGTAFDFVFVGDVDTLSNVSSFVDEVSRTLRQEGYLVVHTKTNDTYSLHSLITLLSNDGGKFTYIHSRMVESSGGAIIREVVFKREEQHKHGKTDERCEVVEGYKQEIVRTAEPLIGTEPLKPWITLKKNVANVKYLTNTVDIGFKRRYVYVDVGARSYGSSIGSWFKKQYPKQNKTFEVYAVEADKTFYQEYREKKKWVKLLPYAAWVRNETLMFEVNHEHENDVEEKVKGGGKGMGRIKAVQEEEEGGSRVEKIEGFDFAEWLKRTVKKTDFVVMKMDVEGTEFDLIPRLVETGAICLIDEIFLECHYNRWQRCCPGQRSEKYSKTYGQCLDLFRSLRERGVLVHQWW